MDPFDNDPELDGPVADPLAKPDDFDIQTEIMRAAFVEQGKVIGELSQRVDGILREIQEVKAALSRHRAVLQKIVVQLNIKNEPNG